MAAAAMPRDADRSDERRSCNAIVGVRRPPTRVRAPRCAARRLLARRSARASRRSLTRRIVVLNLGGLVALLVGFLYLNQFRARPDRRARAEPATQGEIIAARDRRLGHGRDRHDHASIPTSCCSSGRARAPASREGETVARILDQPRARRPAAAPSGDADRTRARIYDRDGLLLLDSRSLTRAATSCASTCRRRRADEDATLLRAHLDRCCAAGSARRDVADL